MIMVSMQQLWFVRTRHGIVLGRNWYRSRWELRNAVRTLRRVFPGERIVVRARLARRVASIFLFFVYATLAGCWGLRALVEIVGLGAG